MKQGAETTSFKQVMDVIREISEGIARVDERTAHVVNSISRIEKDIEKIKASAAERHTELDRRVDELSQDLAVTKRLLKIVWSILATIGAGAVSLGVWVLKSGVK